MRLLKVEKMMRAKSPVAARTAAMLPRRSTSPVRAASRAGSSSGMRRNSRCSSDPAVSTSAIASVHPIPSSPMERPLKTLVTVKARPCTVPTMPLALAWRSSGTSRVTVVESAMLRMFSTTAPMRMMVVKNQNAGPPMSTSCASG